MFRPGESVSGVPDSRVIVLPPHIQPSPPPSSLLLSPTPMVGAGLDTDGVNLGRNLNR